jgi:hypothetical protein
MANAGKKKEAERLLTMLKCEAESSGERCFTRTQIQQTASRVGITTESETLIDALNEQGELLKRGSMFRV